MALVTDGAKDLVKALLPVLKRAEGALAIVGFCYAGTVTVKFLWRVTNGVRIHFWSRIWRKDLVALYGRWAVVTGSTDGIGKSYAKELARLGMNVLLVSRTKAKLEAVANEIKTQYGVKTEVVQADFSEGRSIYGGIEKHLEGKEIGILVNNVGFLPGPKKFGNVSEDDIWRYANINIASVPAMTKIVLPKMLARRKGAIVNVSSVGAHYNVPLLQIYCASKAFVSSFTKTLQHEYSSTGLTIQCIEPGAVITNMTKFDDSLQTPSFFVAESDAFAANAVATLGYSKRSTGYWPHGIQLWMFKMGPEWLLNWIYNWMEQ